MYVVIRMPDRKKAVLYVTEYEPSSSLINVK